MAIYILRPGCKILESGCGDLLDTLFDHLGCTRFDGAFSIQVFFRIEVNMGGATDQI